MTIAAGFRCSDGIVLCADRQVSVPGALKYFEKKIVVEEAPEWSLAIAVAGDVGFAREIREKAIETIRSFEESPTIGQVREVLDDILVRTSRLYMREEDPIQLLMALTLFWGDADLLKFDGRALHKADDFNLLRTGNSSLIRFLSDNLYDPAIDMETGISLAAYIVQKAERYIDWCGGAIDIVTIPKTEGVCNWIPAEEAQRRAEKMEGQESLLADLILRQPFSSPSEP